MPRLNVVRPADANETALGVALRAAQQRGADRVCALPSEPPDPRSRGDPRRRDRARRLRPARRRRRRARADPDRHRLGGLAVPGGRRRAGRRPGAGRLDALHGHVRAGRRGLSRAGAAGLLYGPGRGRGGLPAGMGPVDRRGRRVRRDGDLRRVGAGEGRLRAFRDHRGACGGRGPGGDVGDEHDRERQRAPGGADRRGNQRLAGPDPPFDDRGRRARADDRRGVAARRDLQPVDLREGDPRLRRLRRRPRRAGPRATRRRGDLRPDRDPRRPARGRRVRRASTASQTVATDSCRSKSPPTWPTTPSTRSRPPGPTGTPWIGPT